MVKIFYRSGAEILFSQSETELSAIGRENVIWIDMLEPTGEQKRYVEQYLGTEIQSRAEAEERRTAPSSRIRTSFRPPTTRC